MTSDRRVNDSRSVYRVGTDTQLKLAIARTSLLIEFIRQVPILFFLRGMIVNKLLSRFTQALGPLESAAQQPGPAISET